MDVGVHFGTLIAVMIYFRKDVGRMFHSFCLMLMMRKEYDPTDRKLMLAVIFATIPVIIFGGIASALDLIDMLRTIEVIGWTSIIFGILLYWFDIKSPVNIKLDQLKYGQAMAIGFAQVLSLIPGTSRSGITMTAARGLGFSRVDAARFSMLMSIPTIMAAATLQVLDFVTAEGETNASGAELLWGMGLSFVAAILAIAGLLKWLQRSSMTPFVIYRVLLGIGLLYLVYQ